MNNQLPTDASARQGADDATRQLPEYNPMDSPQARRWKQLLYFEHQRAIEEGRQSA